jgi:hypothetical protein
VNADRLMALDDFTLRAVSLLTMFGAAHHVLHSKNAASAVVEAAA